MARFFPRLSGPTALPVVLWAVLIAQAVVVSLLRGGTSYDGSEQLLYSQYLDLGYGRSQPPLYTWLLIGFQQVFGVSMLAENLLKYGLAALALTGLWRLGGMLWPRRGAAGPVMLAFLLIAEISWEMQRNYSHSVLLFALLAWSFVAYLAILARPRLGQYAVFGLLVGLMALAKYNAPLMVLALLAADLWVMGRHAVARRPALAVSLAVAVAVALPHLLWAAGHPQAVVALKGGFRMGAGGGPLGNALAGLGQMAVSLLALFVLILALAAGLFGRRAPAVLVRGQLTPRQRVIWRAGLIALAATALVVVASGATEVRPRWLLPVAIPLVPVAVGRMVAASGRTAVWLRRAAVAVALLVLPGIWAEGLWPGNRTAYDYAALAGGLRQATGADAAVFTEYAWFANLRLGDAALVVADPAMPRWPGLAAAAHPVAVWRAGQAGAADAALAFAAARGLVPAPGAAAVPLVLQPRLAGPPVAILAQPLVRQ